MSDICSGEALEFDAVCESCAHAVAAALKAEHDQVLPWIAGDARAPPKKFFRIVPHNTYFPISYAFSSIQALEEYEMYTRQYEVLQRQLQDAEEESIQDKQEALRQAETEEAALLAKSKALEEEAATVRAKVCELEDKGAALQQMHTSYWRDYNDLQLQLRSSDRDSLRRKIESTQAQVEALNKTNVINDAFHIAHNDMFATINGFRLGSVQSQPVDWDEINAAWGQTALLVQTLASHWDFTFPRCVRGSLADIRRVLLFLPAPL